MRSMAQLREEIMTKALVDSDFRQRLIDEPVATLRDDLGIGLPDGFTLHVHEDDGVGSAHIVLPPRGDLTVEELEQMAAGCDGKTNYTWDC